MAPPTGANTVATLNGLFKKVFADEIKNLVPNYALLQRMVKLEEAEKLGDFYAQPVVLAQEAGFTYAGISGGAQALNSAIAGVYKEAQVYGYEMDLRVWLPWGGLTKAAEKGAKAFKRLTTAKVEEANNAARKRKEISMLYGQSTTGIGVVSAITGSGPYTVTLTAASWGGGIWAGMENAQVDLLSSNLATNRGTVTVTSVNSDTQTLTLTGTLTSAVATDVVFLTGTVVAGGTPTFNEMAGLQKILTNTGVLFNIDASAFSLWKGNTVSSVGQLSFAKLQDAISKAVNKGLMEEVAIFCSPKAWAVLNTDLSALRMFDKSYSSGKGENGFESLSFHSQNGVMQVYAHPLVKDGDCFIVAMETLKRVGSKDLTFGRPGIDGDQDAYFAPLQGFNLVELQAMSDEAIFLEKPAHSVFLTGITYA